MANFSRHTERSLYRPLQTDVDELRVLVLEPGSNDEPLTCRLAYWPHPFTTYSNTYETVSYCWGRLRTNIEVDGIELEVPTSAKEALYRLRQAHKQRYLWLDSICLNQSSNDEKSYQVARMHTIYQHGVRNLIWLGPDDGTVQSAMDTIKGALADMRNHDSDLQEFSKIIQNVRNSVFVQSQPVEVDERAFVSLIKRPWFSRLWVVQEVSLSSDQTMFCGNHEFSPIDVHRALIWLRSRAQFSHGDLSHGTATTNATDMTSHADREFNHLRKLADNGAGAHLWEALLTDQERFGAQEPKDRVYALLGMYKCLTGDKDISSFISPNYKKSLIEVYRDATRYAILSTRSLNILRWVRRHCTEQHSDSKHSWLSWVPCWHHQRPPNGDESDLAPFFQAGNYQNALIASTEPDDPDALILLGCYIDTRQASIVEVVSETCTDTSLSVPANFLNEVLDMTGIDLRNTILDDGRTYKLVETLVAGTNDDEPITEQEIQDFLLWLQWAHGSSIPQPRIGVNDGRQAFGAFLGALKKAVFRRKFFITAAGRYGLGPQFMQTGDVVVVVPGSRWPLVLRPREELDDFEFVGLAYTSGIMFGSAMGEVVKEMEIFEIR